MNVILIILAALIVGGIIGFLVALGIRDDKQAKFFNKQSKDKAEHKEKILKIFAADNNVTNNEIQKALGISDASATRYLDELEKDEKIEQVGKEGRGVVYKLK